MGRVCYRFRREKIVYGDQLIKLLSTCLSVIQVTKHVKMETREECRAEFGQSAIDHIKLQ
jgi:hypothetical protein